MKKHLRSVVVGALAAVVAFGGIQVVSAVTSPNEITVCVNRSDGHMHFSKSGKCDSKTQIKMLLNRQGPTGATGLAGATSTAGATGATGATGSAGAAGAAGTSAVKITELSTCGAGGTDLCKVGSVGPGGGRIFFVDYYDQYSGFNYLEAAPADSSTSIAWCSDTSTVLGLNGWDKSAVGSGQANTTTMLLTCTTGAAKSAGDYANGSVTDWFLPSIGETMLMYTNLRQAGVGGFATGDYWSSSESSAGGAWLQVFSDGRQINNGKHGTVYVRPVRAF